MKITIVVSMFLFYPAVISASESEAVNYKKMEEFINASRLEKLQADTMVETMVKSGRFSRDHGEKAKREIASIHEENLEDLKKETIVHVKSHDLANK